MTIRHTLLATLATAALIAPAAGAQPPDMHASTALAAAQARAQEQPQQDLRSPDARDAGQNLSRTAEAPPAGQPTWPVNPTTLAPPAQEPATDDGSPVPVLPLVAGVLVVLAAALAARYGTRRMNRGARIAT